MSELNKFDLWIQNGGPAALVIREHLIPVEGEDGVFFPATYAAQKGADKDKTKFQGGYNIDFFDDKSNICSVDSVGSQANRLEPIFSKAEYAHLVPQIVVKFEKFPEMDLNLLYANHRAGDALFRSSPDFADELREAFRQVLRGNAMPLAKIAPTSLVFGVWDSRDTSAKLPRLVSSTIRAFNVKFLTRSANFLTQQTIDLAKLSILPDAESKDGFANALASRAAGGVQLMHNGNIRRDAILSLSALRRLTATTNDRTSSTEISDILRRYILGLSLVALTATQETYLRQGCNLVPNIEKPKEFMLVRSDGLRENLTLTHDEAMSFAAAAAAIFVVGKSRDGRFEPALAENVNKAHIQKLRGELLAIDPIARTFRLKTGKAKDPKENDFAVNDSTVFIKGTDGSTFDEVLVIGVKLDVEITDGVAIKVTSKK